MTTDNPTATGMTTLRGKITMPDYVPQPVKLSTHAQTGIDWSEVDPNSVLPPSFRKGDGPAATAETTLAKTKKRRVIKRNEINIRREDRLAEVPPQETYDGYVGRKIAGMTYVQVFDYCRTTHTNALLTGPTGSGKTSAVLAYAALRHLPFYSVSSSVGVEETKLFGKWIPGATGGFIWQDGPVTDLFRYGGVLLINEINFIPERVGTVLFSALDKRREIQLVDHLGEVIRAHDELLIVADMNPHYEGTRPLNRALRNRFGIQIEWGYDRDVETALVPVASLRHMADRLRTDDSTSSLGVPVSTNMLVEFDTVVRTTRNLDFALTNFLAHWETHDRQFVDVIVRAVRDNILNEYKKGGVL